MATHESVGEEYLTCYICYDVFTEPKTLACLHRFCEKCLQGYLVGGGAKKNGFLCPVCRELNPAPNTRRPPSDWASLLRTDFHIKSLIKALQPAPTMTRRQGQRTENPCSLHGDKELDLYCCDCSVSICHLCAGISHRGCLQVVTLADAASDRRVTFDLQKRELLARLGRVQRLRTDLDSAIRDLEQQRALAESAIRKASQDAVTAVRRRETEYVEELAQRFQTIYGGVTKRLLTADQQIAACKQRLELTESRLAGSSDAEVIQGLSSVLDTDILNVDTKKMKTLLSSLKQVHLEFVPFVPKLNFGEVVVRADPEVKPDQQTAVRKRVPPPLPPKRQRSTTLPSGQGVVVRINTPVKVRTISAKFREDACPPKLRDILVFGAENILVVTDWANQCVKTFHSRRELDSRLALGGKPWCVTRISDAQVAVSLPISCQICIVKVVPRLALLSSFFAQKRYSGLASLSSETLVASGAEDGHPCVDIINLGGEVLQSFSHDVAKGTQLFSYPGYLSVLPGNREFIVSDRRKAAVVCMDVSGRTKFIFQPAGSMRLQEPAGVASDGHGRVYVAENRGVVRLTAQGQLDRTLLRLKDGVEDPRGIEIGSDGLLYITNAQDTIVVYRTPM
ncbi:E3 ubiquitin-protein ligase TRIM56-like isoform X3 [Pomacea canaliculata]|nr:E3 ubiquitin-protein ligase TRIM56-like isoform X3 [Pomacea canaliculata]XP_025095198.1 E3 ubiquitin-protein ligase TRIM56-like isoform X3 [Pomacea canaliculata]